MTQKQRFEAAKAATVALALLDEGNPARPFKIVGSGFCVDAAGIVFTCQHVLSAFMSTPITDQLGAIHESEKGKPVQTIETRLLRPHVVFFSTSLKPGQLVALPCPVDYLMAKTDYDLGAVRIPSHPAFSTGYPTLAIEEYEAVHEGLEIATCGFPLGNFLQDQLGTVTSSFTKGILSSVVPYQGVPEKHVNAFQLDLVATHGNSGGPVFSLETGRVFGVLQGGIVDRDRKILQGLARAEPVYGLLQHDLIARMKGTG